MRAARSPVVGAPRGVVAAGATLTGVDVPRAVPDDAAIDHFEQHGWVVLPDLLEPGEVARAREALVAAAESCEAMGYPTRIEVLDPGGRNIRVYDLLARDAVFAELVTHPTVIAHVEHLLDGDFQISNFTANIALPGSGSMNVHNDQSTLLPEPWDRRWSMNAIWCLDDVDGENGATRYLPGSHRCTRFDEVPADPRPSMVPFEAAAGSVVLMDGRLWHTSGENVSESRERAMLFALYARSFLRHQTNWWQVVPRDVRRAFPPELKEWLGLRGGNMSHGNYLANL